MKISLNWLKEYIDLDGISTDEVVSKLTMSGLEVEDYTDQKALYKNFITAQVKKTEKHPNADKLTICEVFDGKNLIQVICGAPNVAEGQKVVFAPIGTIIPNGQFEIKKAKIRGIESNGMICAEDELLLSDDHSGIMVLDENTEAGKPVSNALKLNDVIFEVAVTPNRPDALSHFGVARDLGAIFNRKMKIPEINLPSSDKNINDYASIEIEDKVNCPRYIGKVVLNITVQESPQWLKERLQNIGLRPINNIVDVTNFVLHECGQPLHAFDLDRLEGNKIIVKSLKKESSFTTLDSKERKLPENTLMICDGKREVAIAGVMGGENSEISNTTKNILIESAYFNPTSIRRTSKALGLSTDASYRFERGTDPNITKYAAERAALLISELTGGEIADGLIDVYDEIILPKEIQLRFSRCDKILGYEISKEKIHYILSALSMAVKTIDEDTILVAVPTNRPDIEREIDLIEEVARINGYDNIPTVNKITITLDKKTDNTEFDETIRQAAISIGFFEIINNPLQSKEETELTGNGIKIANPLSLDMEYLRTDLLAGALKTISKNLRHGNKDQRLFEIGNVFNRKNEELKSFDDFAEEQKLLFVITGKETEKGWNQVERDSDFYSLKGYTDTFIKKISLDNVLIDSYYSSENIIYAYYLTKNFNDKLVGIGGKIKSDVLKKFDINQDVYAFEFDLDKIRQIQRIGTSFREPLKFPKVVRDFAFVFDKSIKYKDVEEFIYKNSSQLLKKVEVFDYFESEALGKDRKSLAFTLEFYDESRTLVEEEVEKEFKKLINLVTKKFNAQLRGS